MEDKKNNTVIPQNTVHTQTVNHMGKPSKTQLVQYREKTECNLKFLAVLFILDIVIASLAAYYLCGWWSVGITVIINLVGFFISLDAIKKIQKIVWD